MLPLCPLDILEAFETVGHDAAPIAMNPPSIRIALDIPFNTGAMHAATHFTRRAPKPSCWLKRYPER